MVVKNSRWREQYTLREFIIVIILVLASLVSLLVLWFFAIPANTLILSHSAHLYIVDSFSIIALVVLFVAFCTAVLGLFFSFILKAKVLKNLVNWMRPNNILIAIFASLCLLLPFIVVHEQATSKMTWDQFRGVPLPFLTAI